MNIQVITNQVTPLDQTPPGVRAGTTKYFYFPSGDYEAAIEALEKAGFKEGNIRCPGPDYYTY